MAQHLGRSEGQAGEDDALQVGYSEFRVFSRWTCSGVQTGFIPQFPGCMTSGEFLRLFVPVFSSIR